MNRIVSAVLLSLFSGFLKETGTYIGIYIELNEVTPMSVGGKPPVRNIRY